MSRRLAAALMLIAACGCRMCSDSCDYSPPVINGPHAGSVGRAGSAMNPSNLAAPPPQTQQVEPAPQPLTPLPAEAL